MTVIDRDSSYTNKFESCMTVYTTLRPNINVPRKIIMQPVKILSILHLPVNLILLSGLSMYWMRINPGKRKINEAANPPVRLRMYDISLTKMARRREMKNQTPLSTLSRLAS